MALFIGREEEISMLEHLWDMPAHKTAVVWGRRRIGKTELLKRFCIGKRAVFIDCVRGSIEDNLDTIAAVLNSLDGGSRGRYASLKLALDDILGYAREERTVVVFDELPYLLSIGEQVPSLIQHFIDGVDSETDSMVVVCGFSMSVMKRETQDYERPLYGRFHLRMEVGPLSYSECARFHPNMSEIDRMKLYLTVGGVPKYHLDTETGTYREYIINHFLSSTADMSDEATSIIGAEFAPLDRYLSIVNGISDGATSLKELCERAGLDRYACLKCIRGMTEVGVVGTLHPMFGAPKRPVYRIADSMVAFCQDVMVAAKAYPLMDPGDRFGVLEQRISTFLGKRFEDMCSLYVQRNWRCLEIGKWWGVDSERETREIDITAVVMEGDATVSLFAECKFRRRVTSHRVLDDLRQDAALTGDVRARRFVLFSASGFDDDLVDEADEGRVTLVGMDDLVRGLG